MSKNVFKFITTVILLALFAYSQNSFAQLSGSYTIPGTPFATIKQAVDSLNLAARLWSEISIENLHGPVNNCNSILKDEHFIA